MGGGSGGGGQTQQQNQYTNLSPWVQPYVTSYLGAAQNQVFQTDPTTGQITGTNPYNAFGTSNGQGGQYGMTANDVNAANSSVAGFTPLQQQQQQGVANLQNPWQTGAASGQTMQSMNTANQLGASANPQDFQNQVGGYMNPYIQNALNPSLQLLNQQYGQQGAAEQGAATSAGAFGGSREALMQGLNQQNQNLAANQLVGNAYNNAFTAAQNQYNQNGTFQLQAANQAAQNAGQLGALGNQALQNQQSIYNMQGTVGGQQQQQQQNVINQAMQNYNTAQQYPMQQLGQLKNLISGTPITDVTTTQQAAAPTVFSQVAPLGTAGVAGYQLANKAEGGITKAKRFDSGGIAAINRKVMLAPDNYSKQTIDRGMQDGTISKPAGGIAEAIQLSEQAGAAPQTPPPKSTVVDDLKAKVAQVNSAKQIEILKSTIEAKLEKAIEEGHDNEAHKYAADLAKLDQILSAQQGGTPAPTGGMNPASPAQSQDMPQAAPPQPAPQQAAPQGIDQAQSNLPTQMAAEGGVLRLAGGTKPGFLDWYMGRDGSEGAEKKDTTPHPILDWWMGRDQPPVSTKPEDESGRGTITPEQIAYDQKVQASAPKIEAPYFLEHNKPSKTSAPSEPKIDFSKAFPQINIPDLTPKTDTSGVTSLLDKYEKMINQNAEDPEKAKNNAMWMRVLEGSLNAASEAGKVGTNRSAIGAWAEGAKPALAGYMSDIDKINTAKNDKVKQLLALGLTGEQLKMEASKLGISEAELRAKVPLLQMQAQELGIKQLLLPSQIEKDKAAAASGYAEANYKNLLGPAMAHHYSNPTTGGGSVSSTVANEIYNQHKGYDADPKSAKEILALMNPTDKKYLLESSGKSYDTALSEFKKLNQEEMIRKMNFIKAYGARTPTLSSTGLE
jgi:hypothetical protein